ncbi:MAG: valine--tRNA ligase [Bacteroidaceae bacterium]|nr:valine--tRNA ligase [Bacteroidaceae bacterium]
MSLASTYIPAEVEEKWYEYWMKNNLFHSEPDEREPYTIVIPPPNVTGVLHMGHMLNNTIQDILVRHARMLGKNACWVPGTDHASIATEAKVVKKLAEQGIKKSDLTREEFLKHAWEWTDEHGGIILKQLRKLGASCDWDRTSFTMDEVRSESVIKVFCDLYNKGLIYRGLRMVNWDPKAQTALSNEEVIYKEEKSKLYYLKYYVDEVAGCTDGEEADAVTLAATDAFDPTVKHQILHRDANGRRYAVVATTRPETIMGDTAMCINPKDPKNTWLKGKNVIVPLVNRVIPVIEDRYVEIEFGTGCLKVTPAHDTNDYMLGKTHNLETIDIFNADATISEAAGMYVGMDRMEVRAQIAKDLADAGLLEKVEDYDNKVGYSERNSDTAVEPRLCMQWFLRMQHFADIALPPVMEDRLKFYPTKYKTTYNNWLANIQDWCISRQLWWGHRIPAYFLPVAEGAEEKFVVAETREEALKLAQAIPGYENITAEELNHDEDALDTWFSSWLWPISLFNGILDPGNKEISYYYPTNDLVTGPDIIFFWVARMIMAGYEYQGEMPFKNVYFTGIVRDKLGRKMSKSLGNSPDPLDLIARYGADGVRMGIMLSAPAGNDILFDESLCEQGRNFCNKIWNAFRLVKGWNVSNEVEQPESSKLAIEYFKETLAKSATLLEDQFGKYRLNEALMNVYSLFWDEFSAWYLEMVKPAYGSPIDAATYEATLGFFDSLLRLLHPFMPFITEELWQSIQERKEGESLMVQSVKELVKEYDEQFLAKIAVSKEVIGNIRAIRQQKNLSPREPLALQVVGDSPVAGLESVITKMANLTAIENVATPDDTAVSFRVGTSEFAVPMGSLIDKDAEIAKMQEELAYHEKFLKSVEAKLNNPNFVSKAPEKIIAIERKKQSDATEKIAMLKESIQKLSK